MFFLFRELLQDAVSAADWITKGGALEEDSVIYDLSFVLSISEKPHKMSEIPKRYFRLRSKNGNV
jgi:hypothetical protein